eukprot:6760797-Karenia_brevis.AAC.1
MMRRCTPAASIASSSGGVSSNASIDSFDFGFPDSDDESACANFCKHFLDGPAHNECSSDESAVDPLISDRPSSAAILGSAISGSCVQKG